jgi:membrane fusion protein (multidrug efflux system)
MKAHQVVVGVVLFVLGATGGALGWRWYSDAADAGHDAGWNQGEAEEKKSDAGALVITAPAILETLHPTIEAFGSAVLPPGATTAVEWPSELSVVRVLVVPGQAVTKDAQLVQVSASGDAETQLLAAGQAAESAGRALEAAKQRAERGLAARPELIAAEAAANEARQKLERLKVGVPPADGMIRAPRAGVVQAVRAQPGGVAGANTSLVDISVGESVVVQLGVEPGQAGDVAVGQKVTLSALDERDAARFEGTVSLIAPSINPAARLLEVTVTLGPGARPRAGTMLRGELALPEAKAVTIPRAAVVPDGDEEIVFVVRDGKAVRVPAVVGRRSGQRVEVVKGCAPGDQVVVVGQSQLTDGAPVRQEAAIDGH